VPKSSLFSPLRLGAHQPSHRVVMAPLTRMRAQQPGNIPGEVNARYYAQRASAGGLLVTEATDISQRGRGYPATPGIHSSEQIAGWRLVTDALHAKGGLIFLQLWHVGRISHLFAPTGRRQRQGIHGLCNLGRFASKRIASFGSSGWRLIKSP
jgi:N-ethylmaleimide reductase